MYTSGATCDHVIHTEVVTPWEAVDACKWWMLVSGRYLQF